MVTASRVGQVAVPAPQTTQEMLRERQIGRFLEKAAQLGISPKPLELKPLRQGILGMLRSNDTYNVTWRGEVRLSLLGRWSFKLTLPQGGTFTKYNAQQVLMSLDAEALRHPLSNLEEIEEMAVFAEEVDPILAVRVAGRWFEVHRWLKRPYILTQEEAQHLARLV